MLLLCLFQTFRSLLLHIIELFHLCIGSKARRFCTPALVLQRLHLLLELPGLLLCFFQRCGSLRLLLFQCPNGSSKAVQLGTPCEHSAGALGRTAGERTAGIDDLPVQRHNAKAVLIRPGKRRCRIQILRHRNASQQKPDDLRILRIILHQIARQINEALVALQTGFRKRSAPHRGQRQKRRTSGTVLCQMANPLLRCVFVCDHQILHRTAQRRFQRHTIAGIGGDKLRHCAKNAVRLSAVCTEHRLDTSGKALHVSLHVLQKLLALALFPQSKRRLFLLLFAVFQRLHRIGIAPLEAVPPVLYLLKRFRCLSRLLFRRLIGGLLRLLCLSQRMTAHGVFGDLRPQFLLLAGCRLLHHTEFTLLHQKLLHPCAALFAGLALLSYRLFQRFPPLFHFAALRLQFFLTLFQFRLPFLQHQELVLCCLGLLSNQCHLAFQLGNCALAVHHFVFADGNGGLQVRRLLICLPQFLPKLFHMQSALLHLAVALLHLRIRTLHLTLCILVLRLRL